MAVSKILSNKFAKYLLPAFVWAGIIFIISSIPGNRVPRLFSFQDILFHIVAYGIFGWLIIRALKKYYPGLKFLNCIYLTVAIGFIYAIGDEYRQVYVPYRDASMLDIFVDTIGALAGSLFFHR